MRKKILLIAAWFPLTFVLLVLNVVQLVQFQYRMPNNLRLNAATIDDRATWGPQFAASAGTSQVLSAQIQAADARVYLVESFLTKHHSPIAPFSGTIINEADRNSIDFRLIPAIAMCESGAGKRMPKKDEFNAFGIAVYTGQNFGKAFDSWPHAISWVSDYIRTKYYDRGITDLKDIGAVWAPPSVQNDYSWTKCVETFMNEII